MEFGKERRPLDKIKVLVAKLTRLLGCRSQNNINVYIEKIIVIISDDNNKT